MIHLLILLSLFITVAFLGAGLAHRYLAESTSNRSLHQNCALFCLLCCFTLAEQLLYPDTAAVIKASSLLVLLCGAGIRISLMSQTENQRFLSLLTTITRVKRSSISLSR